MTKSRLGATAECDRPSTESHMYGNLQKGVHSVCSFECSQHKLDSPRAQPSILSLHGQLITFYTPSADCHVYRKRLYFLNKARTRLCLLSFQLWAIIGDGWWLRFCKFYKIVVWKSQSLSSYRIANTIWRLGGMTTPLAECSRGDRGMTYVRRPHSDCTYIPQPETVDNRQHSHWAKRVEPLLSRSGTLTQKLIRNPAIPSDEPSNRQSVNTGLRSNSTTPAPMLNGCGRACKLL
jgi:hypothetical protein